MVLCIELPLDPQDSCYTPAETHIKNQDRAHRHELFTETTHARAAAVLALFAIYVVFVKHRLAAEQTKCAVLRRQWEDSIGIFSNECFLNV